MRKQVVVPLVSLVALAGGGALAWWKLRPPPAPPEAADEKRYEDIARPDYEKWMQDLGYTE